jgi:ABC-type phosphate transport system permease subunit
MGDDRRAGADAGLERVSGAKFLGDIRVALPDARDIEIDLVLSDAKAIAAGLVSSKVDPLREATAASFARADSLRVWATVAISLGGAFIAGVIGIRQVSAAVAVLTTLGIVLSLIFETFNFFASIGWRVDKFLFGTRWSPLSGVQDGMMDMDKVGAVPLFAGTLMITGIAMLVAVPIGLFAAIYLSDDVINAVPQTLRDGSYALGATKAETMIVVMAAGQGANLTANPLEAATTVTVQIVMLITGDTEASTAAGPAFTLFCITLALNIFALRFVRKYREMYD